MNNFYKLLFWLLLAVGFCVAIVHFAVGDEIDDIVPYIIQAESGGDPSEPAEHPR